MTAARPRVSASSSTTIKSPARNNVAAASSSSSTTSPRKPLEATCSNGINNKPATSRVERIRQQTGAGYVGLNVSEEDLEAVSDDDPRSIVWFDIDNTLYHKSTRIADLMGERIHAYFLGLGLPPAEAKELHQRYYSEHGLAIRGLLKNHSGIDPLDYNRRVDGSLPLDDILKPEAELTQLIKDLDRTKCRVFALTNAYKTHGQRCIKLLDLEGLFDGIVYCDYAAGPLFCCKPDKAYFLAAAEIVRVKDTTRFFFVDDSAKNIKASRALGWGSSVLYKEDEPVEASEPRQEQNGRQEGATVKSLNDGLLAVGTGGLDEEAIKERIRSLSQPMRIRLLNIVLDAAMPGDLLSIKRTIERQLGATKDIISNLPDSLARRVFERVPVRDLLRCALVCKKWQAITTSPELWRSHALALTETDAKPLEPPSDPHAWRSVVRNLYIRERNWSRGLAQSIQFCRGHTGFVTSMKLRGRDTLVTGSHDGTLRVWDLSSTNIAPVCRRVIKADKIACLDFLVDSNLLAAGLYDTGRILLFDLSTGSHLQTLSGHNRGIRHVAIDARHVVSVGQDKAICVWDHRTGERVARFGQQSNVSLGVSLVGEDKLVAVTIDGVIRAFSIAGKRLVGEYSLARLGRGDERWAGMFKDFSGESGNLAWFAAHRNSITVASKTLVVHLEWPEHLETTTALRRRDSSESMASSIATTPSRTPSSRTQRTRTTSNASTASASTSASIAKSPSASRLRSSRSSLGGSKATSTQPSTPSSSLNRSKSLASTAGNGLPTSSSNKSLSSSLSGMTPSSSTASLTSSTNGRPARTSYDDDGEVAAAAVEDGKTTSRFAPNLAVPPRIVSVLRTPEVITGAVHPQKRRVICSPRFASRTGAAERGVYVSTCNSSSSSGADSTNGSAADSFVKLSGAWSEQSNGGEDLSTPERNPMCIEVDDEGVVVGCSDGLVYRVSFAGTAFNAAKSGNGAATQGGGAQPEEEVVGDATIKHLDELRDVEGWRDLFVKR